MGIEEQLDLIDQVMADRSITSRPGPRIQKLRELGLPSDADITELTAMWRHRATARRYIKGQPKFG